MNATVTFTLVLSMVLVLTRGSLAQTTRLPDKPIITLYYCERKTITCEYGYTFDLLELRRGTSRASVCPQRAEDIQCDRDASVGGSFSIQKKLCDGRETCPLLGVDGYNEGCGLSTHGAIKYVCRFSGFYLTTTTIAPPTTTTTSPPPTTTTTTPPTTTTSPPPTTTTRTPPTTTATSHTNPTTTPPEPPTKITTPTGPPTTKSSATSDATTKADEKTSTRETDGSTPTNGLPTTEGTSVTPNIPDEGEIAQDLSHEDKTELIVGLSVAGVILILLIIIVAEMRRRKKQGKDRGFFKEDQSPNPDEKKSTAKEEKVAEGKATVIDETLTSGLRERRFRKKGEDNKTFFEEAKSDKNFPESDSDLTVEEGKLSSGDSGVGDATYTDADVSQDMSEPDDEHDISCADPPVLNDNRDVSHDFTDPEDGPMDNSSEIGEDPSSSEVNNVRPERRHVSFADPSVQTETAGIGNSDNLNRITEGDRVMRQKRSNNEPNVSGPVSEDEVLY